MMTPCHILLCHKGLDMSRGNTLSCAPFLSFRLFFLVIIGHADKFRREHPLTKRALPGQWSANPETRAQLDPMPRKDTPSTPFLDAWLSIPVPARQRLEGSSPTSL